MAFFQIVEIPEGSPWSWSREDLIGSIIQCDKKNVKAFNHKPGVEFYDMCFFYTGKDYLDNSDPQCLFAICKRLPGSNL